MKPEFFEDETIGALTRDARLMVIGTFLLADDEGLLRWTPPYIKAGLFMYDDDLKEARIASLMKQVEESQIVLPYVGGKTQSRLGWIVKFRKHQRINRPQASKLPPPSVQMQHVLMAYGRRDDWTCGICSGAISPDPVDWSNNKTKPSLDHIIPRSKGGSHYPTNIRLAHFSCNASRGNGDVNHSVSEYVNRAVNDSTLEVEVEVEGNGKEVSSKAPNGVSEDQSYLANRLTETWGERGKLTFAAIQKLNNAYGMPAVSDAMRSLRGFPPQEAVRSVYAYIEAICQDRVSA